MDRKELTNRIQPFLEACTKKEYPLDDHCIYETFPGDDSTSFTLEVKAKWADEMNCSDILDILTEILWDTVDMETRKKIFSINVVDSNGEWHCSQELD